MDLAAASLRQFLPESELSVTPSDPRPTPDRLWKENAAQLAGLIRALGIRSDRVDDVLQDLYLAVARGLPEQASGDDARRWLFRVAANRCRLEHRKRSRWQRLLTGFAAWTHPAPQDRPAQDGERSQEIDAALERLDRVEREVVVLRYFCELNSREIGEVLEMSESTVRSHLAKARRQLARDLADWKE